VKRRASHIRITGTRPVMTSEVNVRPASREAVGVQ
jgi:hypothetical protein